MKRTLVLKKELLAALTSDELSGVQGGAIPTILGICQWTQDSSPLNCPTGYRTCPLCPE